MFGTARVCARLNPLIRGRSTLQSRIIVAPSTMAPARKQSTLPESYKEDISAGAMLRYEASLPKLPVPTLEETSKRYLKSLEPLLTKAEYAHSEAAVADFVKAGGVGETLQKRLIERANTPGVANWLTEWWNSSAYLSYTGPVVPYVSYFYSHRDDRQRRDPAKRAAAIATAVLSFAKQVNEKTLEPEYMKKLPLAMSSYKYMFNTCRIPAKPEDYPIISDYKQNEYILVIRQNSFYKVPYTLNGKQLSAAELEHQFNQIYKNATRSEPVGVLTTEDRHVWADARERLVSNPVNKATLEAIQAASFTICLDDAKPVTLNERARQYWQGDGCNRWFDKPLQFIINDNGTAGFNGEHSMMDGTPTHRLNDYVNEVIFRNKVDLGSPDVRSNLPPPTPLKFELSGENRADIALAQTHHVSLLAQHELRVEAYQGYGKGLIKKFKCSPDGYVQMIIQLAYHKFAGKNRPTYESAATRRFQEGRTETCRSVSTESAAWCQAMAHPLSTQEECRKLFRAAVASQGEYIVAASAGKGVDRHLFGLKKSLVDGEAVPEIFKDPAFSYSSSWFVSSSQLSSEWFNGYGWSQVIDEGFGIAYMINENSLQFNVVCKNLGADRMAFYLNEAAGDMRDMLMPELEAAKPKL